MFCFQCQETAKGTGCTLRGVCGKLPETSRWMDLLLSVVRGVGTIYDALLAKGAAADIAVDDFIVDALFATITNANFDDDALLAKVDKGLAIKHRLLDEASRLGVALPKYHEVEWGGEKADYQAEGDRETVLRNSDEDVRSLKELTVLGLKGMAAYYEHAARLGFRDESIIRFMASAPGSRSPSYQASPRPMSTRAM